MGVSRETTFTPGPWKYDRESSKILMDDGDICPLVATVNADMSSVEPEQAHADGALIAAALEMLAALEFYANAEAWKDGDTGIGPTPGDALDYGATARAAIAKARGVS